MSRKTSIDERPAAEGQRKHKALMDDLALRFALSTRDGRRFVWRIIDEISSAFSISFTGNSETFYREGRRSVGIDLAREIQNKHPEAWVLMLQEQLAERRALEEEMNRE